MTPLPAALGGDELVAWRLNGAGYAASWDSGEGAFLYGGRWNGKGECVAAVVYTYDHHVRELSKRLTQASHDHHDLSLATMHVHLDELRLADHQD